MIMALGTCCIREALPFVEDLATRSFKARAVCAAIGDALVRLSRAHEHDATKAVDLLRSGNEGLCTARGRDVADEAISGGGRRHSAIRAVAPAGGWSSPLAGSGSRGLEREVA